MEPTINMVFVAVLVGAGGGLFRVLLGWFESGEVFDMSKTPRQFAIGIMTGLVIGIYLLLQADAYTISMLLEIFLFNALGVITIDKIVKGYIARFIEK